MEGLVGLLLLLLVVTVVGHGLWLLIALLLRGGRPAKHRADEPNLSDDRAATARYLEHLRSRGLLDQDTHTKLLRVLADEAGGLTGVRSHLPRKQDIAITPRATDDLRIDREPAVPPTSAPPPPAAPHESPRAVSEEPPPVSQPGPRTESTPAVQPEPEPAQRRRPFTEVMVEFMAEKNIRWGEIIGGLLILCCSTALVISLWSQITAIPVLKFVIFTTVTAALFGVGLFVQHRWKLPMTGHALLVISSMLVPLNLLAFAAFSEKSGAVAWTLAIEFPTVTLFAWLTFLAGRVIMPVSPKTFAGGVAALSSCSIVIQFISPATAAQFIGAAFVPVGLYLLIMALFLRGRAKAPWEGEAGARQIMLQLGVQTFACLIPFGMLVHESGQAVEALSFLSALICAIAVPGLMTGLFLVHRLSVDGSAQLRTAAVSIALAAASVMLLCVALAWPVPARLMPVLLVNAAAVAALRVVIGHRLLHGLAIAWVAAAWVLGVHVALGHVGWLTSASGDVADALLSAATGQALIAVTAVCGLMAYLLLRRDRRPLFMTYGATALAFAVVTLVLVTRFGFAEKGDPDRVTWVYVLYAVVAWIVAVRWRIRHITWIGCILAQMGLIQGLVYLWPLSLYPWPTTLLVGGVVFGLTAIVLKLSRLNAMVELVTRPAARFAVGVSLIAAVWIAVAISPSALAAVSARFAWIAGLWLALAIANRWPIVFAGSQITLVVAGCTAVQQHLRSLDWYASLASPLREPWVWQWHAVLVASICLGWGLIRLVINRRCARLLPDDVQTGPTAGGGWCGTARRLLTPNFTPADHALAALAMFALIALAVWSVLPVFVSDHGWHLSLEVGRYDHAGRAGSWVLAAILAAILAVYAWDGTDRSVSIGFLLLGACSAALFASRFEPGDGSVQAFNWLSSGLFVVASVLYWTRHDWLRLVRRTSSQQPASSPLEAVRTAMILLLALPVIVLTATYVSAIGYGTAPIQAGVTDAWLRMMVLGPVGVIAVAIIGHALHEKRPSYAVSAAGLGCIAFTGIEVALLAHGNRSLTWETAIWLLQINTILFAAVPVCWHYVKWLTSNRDEPVHYPRPPLLVARALMGLVLLAAVTALWADPSPVPSLVAAAGTLWGILAVILVEWALLATCREPALTWQGYRESVWLFFGIGLLTCAVAPLDTGGWLCFHVAMVSLVAAGWLRLYLGARQLRQLHGAGWRETFDAAAFQASGTAGPIGRDLTCATCGYNLRGLELSGRCPECGTDVNVSVKTALERLTPRWALRLSDARTQAAIALFLCTVAGMLFALRAAFGDPHYPWWSIAALLAFSALCVAAGGWLSLGSFAYIGGATICLAASIGWSESPWCGHAWPESITDLIHVNIVALALLGIAWLLVETRVKRRTPPVASRRWRPPSFHHVAGIVLTGVVSLLALESLLTVVQAGTLRESVPVVWLAWASVAALIIACGLDSTSRYLSAGLYALGMAAIVRIVATMGIAPGDLAWTYSLVVAAYVLATTLIWRIGKRWFGGHQAAAPFVSGTWLLNANASAAMVAVLLAAAADISHAEITVRMLVIATPLLCAAAAWLAVGAGGPAVMETCIASLIAVAAVLFAWAWIPPDRVSATLHRGVGLFAAMASFILLASAMLFRLPPEHRWRTAITRVVVGAEGVAGLALLYVAGVEGLALPAKAVVPLSTAAIAAMIVALSAMIVACILFATNDRLDPLRLRPTAREAYVYVAEALGGLLSLHLGATMPWLFSGVVVQYWPIVVLLLAFAAVAAAEACRRYGQRVLARPLGYTGIFLPVLVLPELFIASARVHYSAVLLATGALYAVLAAMRRSIVMAACAALAFNGSLWYLLYRTPGLGILQHPQLWFIPPALAVLYAGYLNRHRLREQDRATLNYACLLVIYLSSTADIFLIGVARAPWLPLVLGGLSIVGVFFGVASRIRSFLLLGTGFLCVSLLTIVWHAATNLGWTWVWYVAGIVLGIVIITIFALFEKKRQEMRGWLEEFRSWES